MDERFTVYLDLPIDADQEIRVLKLEPAASFTDPIITSLFVRSINDTTYPESPLSTYHGVSYCWGTGQDIEWMRCNDQQIQITANVDVMLRHFRKDFSPRNLWVDAICINQAENVEKSKQVRAMGRIYENADKVHIWLGPAGVEDNIPSIFATFRKWASYKYMTPTLHLQTVPPALLSSFKAFMARPWLTRRWVIQEVSLAHAATVHCGDHRIAWAWLCHAIEIVAQDYDTDCTFFAEKRLMPARVANALSGLASLRHRNTIKASIFTLLWDHHSSLCADERDRLFALYGMTNDINSIAQGHQLLAQCPVDYSRDFRFIYTQLATAAMRCGLSAIILNHAFAFGSLAQQNSNWPSWVPSWNRARKMRRSLLIRTPKFELEQIAHPITLLESNTIPGISTTIPLFPVLSTYTNSESGSHPFKFLKSAFQAASHSFEITAPAELVKWLVRTIEICDGFYDRKRFDFNAIFNDTNRGTMRDWNETGVYNFKCLQYVLHKELFPGSHPPDLSASGDSAKSLEREYSTDLLEQEVDRILQGHTLFEYEAVSTRAIGIAYAKIEQGDYIAYTSPFHPGSVLVLRPHAISSGDIDPTTKCFRLVGCSTIPLSAPREQWLLHPQTLPCTIV